MGDIIKLKPGQAKPLELEQLEEKSYAQQAVEELEAAIRKVESISPAELAYVKLPDRHYPRTFNAYINRLPVRLQRIGIEVHNYAVRVARLQEGWRK